MLPSGFTGPIVIPGSITELTIDGGGQTLTGVYIEQASGAAGIDLTIKDLNITAPELVWASLYRRAFFMYNSL